MYNCLWYVGSIIAAWTVFGTIRYTTDAAWRIPVAMQAAMPVIQILGIWLLPESPRWLCSKDRLDEAFSVLAKVRRQGACKESEDVIWNGWWRLAGSPKNIEKLTKIFDKVPRKRKHR
jgi:hypothetical protein